MGRTLLILALAIGVNATPCSAAASLIGIHVLSTEHGQSGAMTPEDRTHVFCMSWTPQAEESDSSEDEIARDGGQNEGCGDSRECLQQSAQTQIKTANSFHAADMELDAQPVALFNGSAFEDTDCHFVAIRDGPLHETASLLAHALIKRE